MCLPTHGLITVFRYKFLARFVSEHCDSREDDLRPHAYHHTSERKEENEDGKCVAFGRTIASLIFKPVASCRVITGDSETTVTDGGGEVTKEMEKR